MESEVSSSRILIYPKNGLENGGLSYLKSFPGILRALNVLLSLLSLILVLLGFADEYSYSEDEDKEVLIPDRYERRRKPWLRLTSDGRFAPFENYYGAGYGNERVNVAQLVCIVICLVFSAFYLFFLVISPECHHSSKRRGWNRFLNLSIAIIQFVGFLNGVLGLLLFRSYCCHVDFSGSERHKSELEGYFLKPCLCYITPAYYDNQQAGDNIEYKTLFFHDAPDDIVFYRAQPHHFIPHIIALCFSGINFVLQFMAAIFI